MMALIRIWTIALNTVREAIRNKLLYALLFFSVLLIVAGVAVSTCVARTNTSTSTIVSLPLFVSTRSVSNSAIPVIITGETSRAGAHALLSGLTIIRPDVHLVEEHSKGRVLSSATSEDAAVVFEAATTTARPYGDVSCEPRTPSLISAQRGWARGPLSGSSVVGRGHFAARILRLPRTEQAAHAAAFSRIGSGGATKRSSFSRVA